MAQAVAKPAAKKARRKSPTKEVRSGATRKTKADWDRQLGRTIQPDEIITPQADNGRSVKSCKRSYKPTEEDRIEVEEMVKIGCSHASIAVIKRIDVKTLKKHFARELEVGPEERARQLRNVQWEMAVHDKSVPMAIWLGKNMLGQTDKVEGSGMGGDIVQYKVEINVVGAK